MRLSLSEEPRSGGEPRQIKGRSPLILARAPPSLIEAVRAKRPSAAFRSLSLCGKR